MMNNLLYLLYLSGRVDGSRLVDDGGGASTGMMILVAIIAIPLGLFMLWIKLSDKNK